MLKHLISASALILLLVLPAHADPQPALPQTPQINPQQEPDRPLKPQEEAKQPQAQPRDLTVSIPQPANINLNHNPAQKAEGSDDEGTEYWPKFWDLHLKITDSLLALFTLLLFVATGALWFSTNNLWRITRNEFVATHRPKLLVREVTAPLAFPTGIFITCFVTIANIGETDAAIIESNIRFDFVDVSRFVHSATRIEGRNELSTTGPIHPGETHKFTVTEVGFVVNNEHNLVHADDRSGLFITGHITYIDGRKIQRQLAFRRKYDPVWHRFVRVSQMGEEYEYAD